MIAIYYKNTKLGYIPKYKNELLSNLMYFGYSNIFETRINYRNLEKHPEEQIRIVIKIKDNRFNL